MLATTRLCALFICLLRQCRACANAGGNNSKKIIMITIFSLPSLSFFVLSPKRLLSDYLKYLRASQHKIPSVTSRVFFFCCCCCCFSCSRASQQNERVRSQILFFFSSLSLSHVSVFEIMRQMLDCGA